MQKSVQRRAYDETNSDPSSDSWLKAYVLHQSHSESPLAFHFWTGVSTIAAALQRKVWINQHYFQWTPNMYIVLVGPPGVAAKSTTIRNGLKLLEHLDDVYLGPSSVTWQALLDSFNRAQREINLPGRAEPVQMACLTIGAGELGTFLNPSDREFIDLLTNVWDGQEEPFRRTTRKDGDTVVKNPWLNLIGCTTPAWLKQYFPDVMVGGGLTSRIIFVYGSQKQRLVAYPGLAIAPDTFAEEEALLLHDLKQIAELQGEYKLTDEAISWGEDWYSRHNLGDKPAHLTSGRFDGYLSRKQAHIHKLAMVLAAAARNELVVTSHDLQLAETQITGLESTMVQVFESIGVQQGAKVTSEVLTVIKNHRKIDYISLFKQLMKTLDQKSFVESVKAALDSGLVDREEIPGTPNDAAGRPKNFNLIWKGDKK